MYQIHMGFNGTSKGVIGVLETSVLLNGNATGIHRIDLRRSRRARSLEW